MSRFPIPSASIPVLWNTALQDYGFAADITGSLAGSTRDRNGKAVGHLVTDPLPGYDWDNGSSQIGFCTDRWGNQIWITGAASAQYAVMQKYSLWGRNKPLVLPLARFTGNSGNGDNALLLMGKLSTDITKFGGEWADYSQEIGATNSGQAEIRLNGFNWAYSNAIGALQGIDALCQQTGKPLGRPIVVLLFGKATTVSTILTAVGNLANLVVNVIAPFAASMGVPELQQALSGSVGQTIQQVVKASEFFANGGTVTLSTFGEYLLPLAGKITPAKYLPTFNDAATVYQAAIAGDYATMARTLGVSEDVISLASGDLTTTAARLGIVSNSTLATAGDILHSVATLKMTDVVSRWGGKPEAMITELLQHDSRITAIPFVQELFLNASAGSAVQIVPNLPNVLSLALSGDSEDAAIDAGGVAQWGGMALTALGFPTSPELFDPLAYSAVREQVRSAKNLARQVGQTLDRFTLPASVPANKRAAFAEYLSEDEQVSVDGIGSHSFFVPYAEYP